MTREEFTLQHSLGTLEVDQIVEIRRKVKHPQAFFVTDAAVFVKGIPRGFLVINSAFGRVAVAGSYLNYIQEHYDDLPRISFPTALAKAASFDNC